MLKKIIQTDQAPKSLAGYSQAVKAYAFQAQVRPFDVFFLTNKYSLTGNAQSVPPAH